MGVYLSDYECTSKLIVSEERLEELKNAAASCMDRLTWKEDDPRIERAGEGLFRVSPVGDGWSAGEGWFTGEWGNDWEGGVESIVELCEPGSIVDVYVDDCWEFHRFAKLEDGNVSHEWRPVSNPFGREPEDKR